MLKSGIPWELLPQEMGCGSGVTCWRRLRDWQQAGVWERLHQVLLDRLGETDRIDWSRAHLVVEVHSTGLVDVIGDIKSNATRVWWQHGGQGTLWQRSFHDHGIRGREDFEATVAYILENPIKAGLVETWEEYRFMGGTLVEEA